MLFRLLSRNWKKNAKQFEKLEEKFKDDLLVRSKSGVKKVYCFAAIAPACFVYDIPGFIWDLTKQLKKRHIDGSTQTQHEREYQRLLVLYWYLR